MAVVERAKNNVMLWKGKGKIRDKSANGSRKRI
jgi:hypothetical protein